MQRPPGAARRAALLAVAVGVAASGCDAPRVVGPADGAAGTHATSGGTPGNGGSTGAAQAGGAGAGGRSTSDAGPPPDASVASGGTRSIPDGAASGGAADSGRTGASGGNTGGGGASTASGGAGASTASGGAGGSAAGGSGGAVATGGASASGGATSDAGAPTFGSCAGTGAWQWEDLYPGAEGSDIIALYATSPSNVWESRGKHGYVEHFDGAAWSEVPLSPGNVVTAIHGSSASDVWAVGTAGLVAHYDGVSWSCAARATPSTLRSVHVNGPSDAWATADPEASVVSNALATAHTSNLLHWNGARWSRDDSIIPRADCIVYTGAPVWGSGARDVWTIIGRYCLGAPSSYSVVVRWDGTAWGDLLQADEHGPSATTYFGGSASSPTSAVVLQSAGMTPNDGFTAWNGASWANSTDTTRFNDVWSASANDVWLVANARYSHVTGTQQDGAPGAAHVTGTSASNVWLYGPGGGRRCWDGGGLFDVSSTLTVTPRGEGITTIWGSGSDAVWAITSITGSVLRHTSAGWVSTGSLSNLKSVWGTGPTDLYAVGAGDDAIHHYDGQTWTQKSTGVGVELTGIWGSGAADIWAVGNATSDGAVTPRYYTTTLHYDGSTWTRVAVEAAGAGTSSPHNLLAVHGTGATSVWAVDTTSRIHWDGARWTASAGGGYHLWTYGPTAAEVVTTGLAWGTSGTDQWSYVTNPAGDVVLHFDGTSYTIADTGVNSTASVVSPKALWVGPHDVYLAGDTGVTLHLTR